MKRSFTLLISLLLFVLIFYGFSPYDSSGSPASTQLLELEKRDTVSPIFEYTMDCCGYVPDKSLAGKRPAYVKDMPDDSAFRSNMSLIYFDKEKSYNYIFEHKPFVPGNDRYVEWSLTPINPKLDACAVISFTDRAGNDTTLIVQHWTSRLDITPHVKDFGKLKTGESRSFPFKVTNKSTAAYVKLNSLRLQKGDQGFKLSYTFDPEIPIAPGEWRDFTVTFTAPGEGEFSDWIGIDNSCCFDYTSNIYAGVGEPKITVTDAAFPTTNVDEESQPIKAIIKNTGNTQLLITGIKGPIDSVFRTNLTDLNISPDNPVFLGANKELEFDVWFKPGAAKTYQDSIVFVNDGDGVDSVCFLTGDGFKGISEENISNEAFSVKILPHPLDSRGGQLEFENPSDGTVEILLFNSLNQQVAVLQSGWMKAGKQSIRLPIESLPSGAYTYRIVAGNASESANFIIEK